MPRNRYTLDDKPYFVQALLCSRSGRLPKDTVVRAWSECPECIDANSKKVDFMFKDLFEYEELFEACVEAFAFGKVTFKRDFGPYKAGDKVENLWFQLESGMVQEFQGECEKPVREFSFRIEAVAV